VGNRLVYALAFAALAGSAQAADLEVDSLKDPLPDTLSWHGITVYGTVDVGYAYQTNGRPLGAVVSTLEFNPVTTTRNFTGQSVSTIAGNGLEQSKIGVKIEENIGYGFAAIGKLDTGFDPLTGELSDGCSSFIRNAGTPYAQQSSNADSGRCGQAFNGQAYGGVTSATYGTLTAGRQQSFELDAIATYDPMGLSYAFSLIGYSGTNGGVGSTQDARWDNSVKYVYQYGPVHAGFMYSNGGEDTGNQGTAYGANAGFAWKGLSVDGVYTKEHDAVNLLGANKDLTAPPLAAYLSDNEAWSIMGKYTYDFGGGFKDEGPGARLTFYGGYTHVDVSAPDDKGTYATTNGGYALALDPNYVGTTKTLDYVWTGAKYELPSGWSFTGAYYYEHQGQYISDGKVCTLGGATRSDCAGDLNQGSFLVDYAFNKHFDVYAGVSYARVDDGLAAGFNGTPCGTTAGHASCTQTAGYTQVNGNATSIDTTVFMTGMRLKF
jgi:predicted porin